MDITIQNLNASKSIHDMNTLVWKHHSRKSINFFILIYGFGCVLFILGMTDYSGYTKTTFLDKTTYYTNWHFTESIGFVIIIMATILLIRFLKSKTKYFKKSTDAAARHLKGTNAITIHLNDNYVIYKSGQMNTEIQWSLFSNYTILKNYLLLYTDDNMLSCIAIDKNLINPLDFNEVLDFVKRRLPYKDSI